MPMVEIDEAALRSLQTGYALLDRLMANPKTKRDAEKLIKTLHPDVVTSEDLAAPVLEPIQNELKELREWKKKQEEGAVESRYETAFGDLKKQGYTEDGIEKIKKLMVDRSVPDVDAAVALFEKQNPKPAEKPEGLRSSAWQIGTKDDKAEVDALMEDESAWARNKAADVLNEIKQNGAPGFGAAVGIR